MRPCGLKNRFKREVCFFICTDNTRRYAGFTIGLIRNFDYFIAPRILHTDQAI